MSLFSPNFQNLRQMGIDFSKAELRQSKAQSLKDLCTKKYRIIQKQNVLFISKFSKNFETWMFIERRKDRKGESPCYATEKMLKILEKTHPF